MKNFYDLYYNDKYIQYKGTYFYQWILRWCAVKIKEYYFNIPDQRKEAVEAIKKLDFSVLPKKYKYLFKTPYLIGAFLNYLDNIRKNLCHILILSHIVMRIQ